MSQTVDAGATLIVHWQANPLSKTDNAVKSNRTNEGKTKKIILLAKEARGELPRPGETWVCRVKRLTNPKSATKGAIFVMPITRQIEYKFNDVWVEVEKAQIMATVLQDRRRNLMLEGDQGVGKSTIARAVAKTLGWEYRKISGGLIKKFAFMLGRHVPDSGSDGKTLTFVWADSKLIEAMREANANPNRTFLIMIDEYTRMDEDARDALLDIIEGKERVMRLNTGEEVPVGKNVVFMGAGNVGEGFTIRREDAAAKDRWTIVKIEAMPADEEVKHCLRLYPNCPKPALEKSIAIINRLREVRLDPKMRLSKSVSTRSAETVAMLLAAGHSIELALETAVTNQFSGKAADHGTDAGRVAGVIRKALED